MNNSSSGSITALVPGGVVTTQNISTVIKPKENNNSMQFVKIQTPDLSKKAVEQIKIAQESKITKDKIKEVEEEWQSNLLNWKSKRRQQLVGTHPRDNQDDEQNNNKAENSRKIKTFAEMIEQRAKAGNRLNFHLQRYIGDEEQNSNEQDRNPNDSDRAEQSSTKDEPSTNSTHHSMTNDEIDKRGDDDVEEDRESCEDDDVDEDEEEEDEESEEEKHQQRIAFVAKLNAFERMTQHPTHSSRRPSTSSHHSSPQSQQSSPRVIPQQQLSTKQALNQQPSRPAPEPLSPASQPASPEIQSSKYPPAPRPALCQPLPPPPPTIPPSQLQSSPRSLPLSQSSQPVAHQPVTHQAPPQAAPLQLSSHTNSHSASRPLPQPPISPIAPHQASKQLPSSGSASRHPDPILPVSRPIPQQQPARTAPHPPPQRSIQASPRPPPSPLTSTPTPLAQQPPPPARTTPRLPPSTQQQDRTVLSVSGKKRCSSCKEELGRGAAAFVIESLNLVYHTNCFRCSVCHVNLSNGFRGVDVRVHTGALHCQNCYSKDGLNYSRV